MFIKFFILIFILHLFFSKKLEKKEQIGSVPLNASHFTGEEVVYCIFQERGITSTNLKKGKKEQNEYDYKTNTVILAPEVYDDASLLNITIAAHEASHSLQDHFLKVFYFFKFFFTASAKIGVILAIPLIIIGFLLNIPFMLLYSHWIILYCLGVFSFLSFLTLYAEADASLKALKFIKDLQLLSFKERKQARYILLLAYETYIFNFLMMTCLFFAFLLKG